MRICKNILIPKSHMNFTSKILNNNMAGGVYLDKSYILYIYSFDERYKRIIS